MIPQAYVSGAQALSACREAGKRLCAPVEWLAACGGSQGYAFPYGPDRVPGRCHDTGATSAGCCRRFGSNGSMTPRAEAVPGMNWATP